METLTIKIKNREKLLFIYEVLRYFDFVELPEIENKKEIKPNHNFFSSAGLWKDREISQETLRKKAWKRD
jgi:hypothetical protein